MRWRVGVARLVALLFRGRQEILRFLPIVAGILELVVRARDALRVGCVFRIYAFGRVWERAAVLIRVAGRLFFQFGSLGADNLGRSERAVRRRASWPSCCAQEGQQHQCTVEPASPHYALRAPTFQTKAETRCAL